MQLAVGGCQWGTDRTESISMNECAELWPGRIDTCNLTVYR